MKKAKLDFIGWFIHSSVRSFENAHQYDEQTLPLLLLPINIRKFTLPYRSNREKHSYGNFILLNGP